MQEEKYTLNVEVDKDNVKITNKEKIHKGEYKATECVFNFSEDFNNLTKKAIFEAEDIVIEMLILDNKCDIPIEILSSDYYSSNLRVYGYEVEEINGEQVLKLRYSPSYDTFPIYRGSYIENAQNTEPITPSDKEQIEQAITNLANEMPTKTSDLDNDSGFIDKSVNNLDNYTKTSDLSNVALSGSYNDLSDKPTIPDVSNFITKDVNDLTYYTLATNTGSSIELSINSSTYVVTLSLKNSAGAVLNTQTIDLPLESVVVSGSYDSTNKKIILTLESGSTIEIPVGDLIAGLQSEITNENKLSSDLVDDTNKTHLFVSLSEKTSWNAKYDKPTTGIPKTDLNSSVQTSLGKADTALQEHQDISGKEDKTNKVTSFNENSTDTEYPSAKSVYDSQRKQNIDIEKAMLVYNALPKVTGTGEEITLNNTAETPIKLELKPSELSQQTTTGKNLLNCNNAAADTINDVTFTPVYKDGLLQYINVNGTASDRADYKFTAYKEFSAGSYILSKGSTNGNCNLLLVASGGSIVKSVSDTDNQTATISTNTSAQFWIRVLSGATISNLKIYPMIRLASVSDDTYEPYTGGIPAPSPSYPMTVHTITGDNQIKVQNKNLLDVDNFKLIQLTSTKSRVGYLFNLKAGTYTISNLDFGNSGYSSFYVNTKYDGETNFIERGNTVNLSTFTMTNDGQLAYTIPLATLPSSLLIKGMLEKNSTATDYVEHQEQLFSIPLGDVEYCKIGNYSDEFIYNTTDTNLELNKWYLKKNIGKVVLDGTDTSTIESGSGTNTYRFRITNNTLMGGTTGYCNTNEFVTSGVSSDTQLVGITGGYIYYRINKSIIDALAGSTNKEKFNNWLSNNNTDLYVPLITPTYTPLNDTLQQVLTNLYNYAYSYQNQTNISQVNDDLPITMNAEAVRDMSGIFEL